MDQKQSMQLAADFWISIFNDLTPQDYNNNTLMSGSAVVFIKEDYFLAGPVESLPNLEALINVGKALMVWKASEERHQEVDGLVAGGEDRESAEREVPSILERVEGMTNPCMKSVTYGSEKNVLSKSNELREYAQNVKETQEEQAKNGV